MAVADGGRRGHPALGAGLVMAAGALLAGWQFVRLRRALCTDLEAQVRAAAALRSTWTVIAAPRGDGVAPGPRRAGRPLRLHARSGGAPGAPAADRPGPAVALGGATLPVVLVHGYGVSGSYHLRLAAQLALRHRVHVPDLPGHGRSDRAAWPLDVGGLADALGRWLAARGIGRAVLVGHSLGAQVVAELAVRQPRLAAGVVLVGPTVDPRARTAAAQLVRLAASAVRERPLLVLLVARDYLWAGPTLIGSERRAMLAHRLEDALVRLAVPTRVVVGSRDRIAPRWWAARAAELAGAPAPRVVRGAGHAVQFTAPAVVAGVVEALLAEVRTPA